MKNYTMLEIVKQSSLNSSNFDNDVEILKIRNEILNRDFTKILIVGCGDSYFAGVAVKDFISIQLGITCIAMTALEFEAYAIEQVDEKTIVIAISMSGNVARTISGVQKAQANGAFVIGMTNSTDGKLFNISKHPLFLGLEEEQGWTPGTLTYSGSIYRLIKLTLSLMKKDTNSYKESLKKVYDFMESDFSRMEAKALEVARNLIHGQNQFPIYILGGGPNYATAKYGAAKFLELCDEVAIGQETEEFAHQEFWVINKNSPVILLAHKGAALARAFEVGEALRSFGIDLISVSSDERFEEISKYSFMMPCDIDEFISPLLYQLPIQLIAYHFSKMKGFDPDNRTHMDPFRKRVSRLLTRGNKNAGY